jgi:hypothetical protein
MLLLWPRFMLGWTSRPCFWPRRWLGARLRPVGGLLALGLRRARLRWNWPIFRRRTPGFRSRHGPPVVRSRWPGVRSRRPIFIDLRLRARRLLGHCARALRTRYVRAVVLRTSLRRIRPRLLLRLSLLLLRSARWRARNFPHRTVVIRRVRASHVRVAGRHWTTHVGVLGCVRTPNVRAPRGLIGVAAIFRGSGPWYVYPGSRIFHGSAARRARLGHRPAIVFRRARARSASLRQRPAVVLGHGPASIGWTACRPVIHSRRRPACATF